jgi:hypothetical protein
MFGSKIVSFNNKGNVIMHKVSVYSCIAIVIFGWTLALAGDDLQATGMQKKSQKSTAKSTVVSFKKNVFPIIKMNCLPCHTEDEMNQSELYLDTYENIMKGGKHGKPIVKGMADSSLIIKKLIPPPPFGDMMPMKRKTPIAADTINVIKKWIDQGAKNN